MKATAALAGSTSPRQGRDLQKWVFKVSETVQERLLAAVGEADLQACDRALSAIEALADEPVKMVSVR